MRHWYVLQVRTGLEDDAVSYGTGVEYGGAGVG